MKRKLLIMSIFCVLALKGFGQNLLKKVNNNHYLELAYYSVKPDKQARFVELQKKTFNSLKKLPGCVSLHSYQDVTNENIFIDLVIWKTLDEALDAADKFVKMPEFSAYNESLDKVKYYSHGELVKYGQMGNQSISDESILEFVAYSIRDGHHDHFINARKDVFDFLIESYGGFETVTTWKSVEDQKMVIDLAFWSDLETAKKAFKESAKQPVFGPFGQTLEQIKFSGDFRKIY